MRIRIIDDTVQLGRVIWEKREIQNVNTDFMKTQCTLSFAICLLLYLENQFILAILVIEKQT